MTELNFDVLKDALQIINQRSSFVDDLSPEQRQQMDMLPGLIETLKALSAVQVSNQLGSFIGKAKADGYHNEHKKWADKLKHLPELKSLVDSKPLGCSAELIKKLVERASLGDYMQISLGKKEDGSLNYLVCVVDKNGNLKPGPATLAEGQDFVDDMRPCPPCNT